MKRYVIALLIGLFCVSAPAQAEENVLLGKWVVDEEATKQNFRNSDEYDKKMESTLPVIIQRKKGVTYDFGEDLLQIIYNNLATRFYYQILSRESDNQIVLEIDTPDQKTITWTVTFLGDDQMTFISDASDEYDHFVWKRLEEEEQQ